MQYEHTRLDITYYNPIPHPKKKTVIKRKTYKEMMQSEWKDNKHMNEYNLTNIGYPTYT